MQRLATAVAVGFLLAAAFMNYRYGYVLGRTTLEAIVFGCVGVLAVGSNAVCPFLIARHGSRRTLVAGLVVLWSLCLTYSLTSAIGFAAENRQTVIGSREAVKANYELTRQSLTELEAKRLKLNTIRQDDRIEALRGELKALRAKGAALEADPQSTALSALTFVDPDRIRLGLIIVFALMVECGAALLLFASLHHSQRAKSTALVWRPARTW
jgi:hypothetical protein